MAEHGEAAAGRTRWCSPACRKGTWEKYRWDKSEIFPNTVREVWIYIPAQYDSKVPACLMVVQDGPRQYAARERTDAGNRARQTLEYATPNVIDNLIARKELPVIITVFINPGSTAIDVNGPRLRQPLRRIRFGRGQLLAVSREGNSPAHREKI